MLLQIVKFGAMKLPIHLPLLLLVASGFAVGFLPSLKALQMRLMFLTAYGAAFIWLWATGQPQSGLGIGKFWLATSVVLFAILIVLSAVQSQSTGSKWSWAFVIAVAFGLFIAFASGPGGEAGWMRTLVDSIFGFTEEDWRERSLIIFRIRKTLHFTGYGIAAFATAWTAYRQKAKIWQCVAAGYAWPLPLAIFDEWQQTKVSTRTGSPRDVFLDFCGMTAFLFVFWLLRRKDREKELEERL